MKANLIIDLTYQFALEVMSAAKTMRAKKEFDLASQFWRAGTSIGANVEEGQAAQSRADFKSKRGSSAKIVFMKFPAGITNGHAACGGLGVGFFCSHGIAGTSTTALRSGGLRNVALKSVFSVPLLQLPPN